MALSVIEPKPDAQALPGNLSMEPGLSSKQESNTCVATVRPKESPTENSAQRVAREDPTKTRQFAGDADDTAHRPGQVEK